MENHENGDNGPEIGVYGIAREVDESEVAG
jgi:hypothetical protein